MYVRKAHLKGAGPLVNTSESSAPISRGLQAGLLVGSEGSGDCRLQSAEDPLDVSRLSLIWLELEKKRGILLMGGSNQAVRSLLQRVVLPKIA